MVEFIDLEVFRIQLQIYFSEGNLLLIQSNHHTFFAVSSLQALRLLCGCYFVATTAYQAALLRLQTSGAAHGRAEGT